jgi:hypothetical protein
MTIMSAGDMMKIEDFQERALAYGGDIDGWPVEDQAAARATLAASDAARKALDEAQALDDMLDLWEGPEPSHALLSRVLADAAMVSDAAAETAEVPAPRPTTRNGWRERLFGGGPIFRPGLALATCLALGFVFGANIDHSVLSPANDVASQQLGIIDFAFAMEDDADLLLGPEVLL